MTFIFRILYRCFAYNIVPCCHRNHYFKNKMNKLIMSIKSCCQKSNKSACFKWTYRLSGNDYKVATLPNCCWIHHATFLN